MKNKHSPVVDGKASANSRHKPLKPCSASQKSTLSFHVSLSGIENNPTSLENNYTWAVLLIAIQWLLQGIFIKCSPKACLRTGSSSWNLCAFLLKSCPPSLLPLWVHITRCVLFTTKQSDTQYYPVKSPPVTNLSVLVTISISLCWRSKMGRLRTRSPLLTWSWTTLSQDTKIYNTHNWRYQFKWSLEISVWKKHLK